MNNTELVIIESNMHENTWYVFSSTQSSAVAVIKFVDGQWLVKTRESDK